MGGGPERPLSNMAMLKLIRTQFPETDATPHGFRSTFRDWPGEQTRFDAQAIEFCPAHTLPNPTQAAYLRTDFLAEPRRIMDEWAHFAVSRDRCDKNTLELHIGCVGRTARMKYVSPK